MNLSITKYWLLLRTKVTSTAIGKGAVSSLAMGPKVDRPLDAYECGTPLAHRARCS